MMKKWIVALVVLLFCASAHAQSCVKDWSSGKRLYEYKAPYLVEYSSGKRLYELDGQVVKEYASGKRLYELDGQTLKDYWSGQRLLESSGIVPRMFLALIALNAI